MDTCQNFEVFLNSLINEDLKFAFEGRGKLKQELVEFHELKNTINLMKSSEIQANGLASSMNIGCDFFVDAHAKDVSKILLNIGANVFFECSLDESLQFINQKEKLLEHQIEFMSYKIAEIEGISTAYTSSLRDTHSSEIPQVDTTNLLHDIFAQSPSINTSLSAMEIAQNTLLNNLKVA